VRPLWTIGLALAVLGGGRVRADTEPDFQAAARAYREGQAAQAADKPAEAARWYELADSIVPAPQALRNAIRSHMKAGQGTRAGTLALGAQRRYSDPQTRTLLKDVIATSTAIHARLTVKCGQPCELLCDGEAVGARPDSEFDVFIKPGSHLIHARFDTRDPVEQRVDLGPGERLILSLEASGVPDTSGLAPKPVARAPLTASPPATPVTSTDDAGVPQWMFWSAAGLTTLAATAGVISAFDLQRRHDAYIAETTKERYESGIQSQRRTNLLFLGSGVAAALTVGLAFFTDWEGETRVAPQVDPVQKSASVAISRRF
jgi:hypothetical protein